MTPQAPDLTVFGILPVLSQGDLIELDRIAHANDWDEIRADIREQFVSDRDRRADVQGGDRP